MFQNPAFGLLCNEVLGDLFVDCVGLVDLVLYGVVDLGRLFIGPPRELFYLFLYLLL